MSPAYCALFSCSGAVLLTSVRRIGCDDDGIAGGGYSVSVGCMSNGREIEVSTLFLCRLLSLSISSSTEHHRLKSNTSDLMPADCMEEVM